MDPQITCPHLIWRLDIFSKTANKCTLPFYFLNCEWCFQKAVSTEIDDDKPVEKVAIYLRRLTAASIYPVKEILVTVHVKNPNRVKTEQLVLISNIPFLNRWCVWKNPTTFIVENELVLDNYCTFTCTMEPSGNFEITKIKDQKNPCAISCLDRLSTSFKNLLEDFPWADVILKCGSEQTKAHKAILSNRSKKFAVLLESMEKTDAPPLEISVDMDPTVFRKVVYYMYTASLPDLTPELVRKIYEAAHEYGIDSLKMRCVRFMMEHISSLKAKDILLLAEKHKDKYLKSSVISHIINEGNISNGQGWKEFLKANPKLKIEMFTMSVARSQIVSNIDSVTCTADSTHIFY